MHTTARAPRVSIVIPSHNRASHLDVAIDSVRSQTLSDWELVVVDDGSTDRTAEVLNRLSASDPRIRIETHGNRRGAQAARNTGIRRAIGGWIAFLDSDDAYLPDSLERRLAVAARDGAAVVHSECLAQRADEELVPFGVPAMSGQIYRDVLARPGPMFQGLLVRRSTLLEIGPLDESITAYQEWDTSIRLARVAEFAFESDPTFVYDLRTPGAISRGYRRSAAGYEQVTRKHAGEILRVCGRRALARHHRFIADERSRAGDTARAIRSIAVATYYWPFSARGTLRSVRSVLMSLRPGRESGG
jgi:glycosyltransferase involved in cell wall biosynthesis